MQVTLSLMLLWSIMMRYHEQAGYKLKHGVQVVAFLAEELLLAGGFDGEMYLFECKNNHWQLSKPIQGKHCFKFQCVSESSACKLLHFQHVDFY